MAQTMMPSKRSFSSMESNALPEKITPPAPQKPGKLKSILKRPSPPSRFMASTPSAQIKMEFHAAAQSLIPNAPVAATATAKKSELETISGAENARAALRRMPPADTDLIMIEDSAAETDLPAPPPRKSKSPKYEDDGDTEDLVTDSQPQTELSDDTLLMSGGLGPGESPYKRVAQTARTPHTDLSPRSELSRKNKNGESVTSLNAVGVLPSVSRLPQITRQVKGEPVTPEIERQLDFGIIGISEHRPSTGAGRTGSAASKREPCKNTEVKLGRDPSAHGDDDLISKMKQQHTAHSIVGNASAAGSLSEIQPDTLPPSSKMARSVRRKANQRQPPVLADVSKMLQEYEETRKREVDNLQEELHLASARASQLEMQLSMLQYEFASQAKHRRLQHCWNLNKYAIFSRRTYSLHGLEEMRVVGGCDDLEEANVIARGMFKSEMNKLEGIVEDLGQLNTFGDVEDGMPKVQMRSTPCGMIKCRSYHPDSRWDLTVERVAAG